MPKQTVSAMVEGGKASAGPPLGPALGPLGVNIKEVIDSINEKTGELKGMQVPVKVIVDTEKKTFEIEVGTPPVSALIKKEIDINKGCDMPGIKRVGDLTEEQVKKISKMKFGSDDPQFLNQVKGTARSMGVTIGKGAITEEELKRYEELDKQRAEEEAAKESARAKTTEEEAPAEAEEKEKPAEAEAEAAEEKPAETKEKPEEKQDK